MAYDGEFKKQFPSAEKMGLAGEHSTFRLIRTGQRHGRNGAVRLLETGLRKAEKDRAKALKAGNAVLFQMRRLLASMGANGRHFDEEYVLHCEAVAEKAAKGILLQKPPFPVLRTMTPAERAKLRPKNFNDLPAWMQWDIDKKLGILDWDGS